MDLFSNKGSDDLKKTKLLGVYEMREEPGGDKVTELGTCPAATDKSLDGINFGTNGGRICWALVGTFCAGEVPGTFAKKLDSCTECDFYKTFQKPAV